MQEPFEQIGVSDRKSVRKRILAAVISLLLVVVLAGAAALLVKQYVITSYIVDGPSMYPTLDGGNGPNPEHGETDAERKAMLTNGETLYLNRIAKIKRGDIVVFDVNAPEGRSTFVKRVIAVAGDRVQIQNGLVYLNEVLLVEPYIYEPMHKTEDTIDVVVPSGFVFCMGDNRNNSLDSRVLGAIALDDIVGKCFLIKSISGKLRFCK